MATLRVSRGGNNKDTCYEITRERTKLGRDRTNHVVVDFLSVSREHAQISKHGSEFFLEDLKSRNGTYINGQLLQDRRKLSDGDEVEICEVVFKFYIDGPPTGGDDPHGDGTSHGSSDILQVGEYVEHSNRYRDVSENSSIVTTLQANDSSRNWRMGIKPEAKLRAVVKILRSLRQLVTLPEVLQAILDGLFETFPQADQGFIMLHEPVRDRLKLEATRTRTRQQTEVNVSMTIVRKAMETGEAILSADAADDSRFNTSDSLQSLQIRSMMCVPLLGKDEERLGVIQLDTGNMVEQFSQEDLDIILAVGTPVSLAITNTRFIQQEIEAKALARELDFAREIQQGYLPKRLPEATRFDISHYYESAEQVGGDYFDCFALKDGHICLAIGDVAGKGIPAALLMSRLYSAVRTQMFTTNDPVAAAKAVNDEFTF
ncbi:MAG: FHA domain-containing protein, partial [Planctomycetaceae bacterium]